MTLRGYTFGDFRVDVPSRTLWHGADVVPVPSRAFDALAYLLEHRDRLVPKDELVAAVWNDVVVTDDSLVHAVSVLRRVLADDPKHPKYIQTIPRRGYRFVGEGHAVECHEAARDEQPAAIVPAGAAPATEYESPLPIATHAAGARNAPPDASPRAAARVRRAGAFAVLRRYVALGVAAIGAAAVALGWLRGPPEDAATRNVQLFQPAPAGTTIVSGGVFSPDGRYLAFAARDDADGKTSLWLRTLSSAALARIDGTEGASQPFWAPDGRQIGYFAGGKLMTVDVRGGAPRSIAHAGIAAAGGTWGTDETILFADWASGVYAVPASGGDVATAVALDRTARDIAIAWPQFLPGERHFLYHVTSLDRERTGVYLGNLDTRQSVRLLDTESPAVFAPPGYLLYVQRGLLIAEEFELRSFKLTGRATLLARDVPAPSLNDDSIVSATSGLVAFRNGMKEQELGWVDRSGAVLLTLSTPTVLFNPRLSPDESLLLATSSVTANPGLWLASLVRPEFHLLETDAIGPIWSPDGERIAFTARAGFDIRMRALSDPATAERLFSDGAVKFLNDWSRDGEHIVYTRVAEQSDLDLWHLRVRDGATTPLLATPFNEMQARLSPDGHWLAYVSDEHGDLKVFVTRYPGGGTAYLVSPLSGGQPQWRADQRELFYMAADRSIIAVDVAAAGDELVFGAPRRLFRAPLGGDPGDAREHYAAAADGTRFLVDRTASRGEPASLTIIVNWADATGHLAQSRGPAGEFASRVLR